MEDADLTATADAPAPPVPDAATVDSPVQRRARAAAALARALAEEPTSFDAFQVVRLLGRLHPERAAVGGWADPSREVVRFRVPPVLAFPAAEVQALDAPPAVTPAVTTSGAAPTRAGLPTPGAPYRLAVNFFGLTGPQAVLPHVYTEHAAVRARAGDTAFRDFLDLLHHRALSLFTRVAAKARPVLGHETGEDDWLLDHLLDTAGLGTPALRARLPLPATALGQYAGLLAQQHRPADGLARLVGDYFAVPATVEQFVGEWRRVDGGGQVTLGTDAEPSALGLGILGGEAWDVEARVRLRLGPLDRATFESFLPGGDAHAPLTALVRLYADDQVGVDVQLVLDRAAVRPIVLDVPPPAAPTTGGMRLGGAVGGTPLGQGSWLVSRPLARDPDETILALG